MTSRADTRAPPFYRFFRGLIRDERGQSETIGVVLLIGITVFGTIGLVAFGSTAISDTEQFMETESAGHTMAQMDSQASEVALGESNSQVVELPRADGAGQSQVVEDGWIKLEVVDDATGELVENGDPVFNESLGAVVYESGDGSVAYQGGGVWKQSGGQTEMVSPPEFHYRGNSLTLPIVQVDGDEELVGEATIRKGNNTELKYPNEDFGNPFADGNHTIDVTIQSTYYEAWYDFFETRTDGMPSMDHENQTVTLSLVAEAERETVEAGVGATDAGEEIRFAGGGPNPTFSDSYDSSEGPYADTNGKNGTIMAAGPVTVTGNAEIHGDIRSGDEVDAPGGGGGNGGGGPPGGGPPGGGGGGAGEVTGDIYEFVDDIPSPSPVDEYLNNTVHRVEADNDNDPDDIDGGELDFTSQNEITLDDGEYHLDRLHVPAGNTLTLDPTNGNVTIGVNEYVDVDGTIHVEGNDEYRAEIFIAGEDTVGDGHHLRIDGGEVTVEDDKAPRMWMYGTRHFDAELNDATYQGVIYAPSGTDTTSKVDAHSGAGNPNSVYGGVVVGAVDFGPGSSFHFDEAVKGEDAVPPDTTVVIVNYLHVTLNEIVIENR